MTTQVILLLISSLVSLSFGKLFGFYMDYEEDLKTNIKNVLSETTIRPSIKEDMRNIYYAKSHRISKKIAKTSLILWIVTCIGNSIWFCYYPSFSTLQNIIFSIITAVVSFMISLIFLDVTDNQVYKKATVNLDDIYKVYFKVKFPEKAYLLTPIYIKTKGTNTRDTFKAPEPSLNNRVILSKFGNYLIKFTELFETAISGSHTEKIFNSEILKNENVEILSKLLIILEDKKLIEQLNLNVLDSAIEFNSSFEKMVNDLSKSISDIQEIDTSLKVAEKELNTQKEAEKVREKLDFLVKQKFSDIT